MIEKRFLIPEPEEFVAETPLTPALRRLKIERDGEIKKILVGESDKLLVIVGPCSAHDPAATLEYVERLGKLNERVKDRLTLVARIYTSKPRTKGVGYKGIFLQPDPDGEADILGGIRATRKLLLSAMEASGLTNADEMLYPEHVGYVSDLTSYYAVGARSVEDQLHRQTASGLDAPVGMKNPTSGSLLAAIHSTYAAQSEQDFMLGGYQVRTSGNPLAHIILRGGVDAATGEDVPDYGYESLIKIDGLYRESGLKNPAVIVDTNHSNSSKRPRLQAEIAREVLKNRERNDELKRLVKGVMIESFLEEGNQLRAEIYGKSITDPCLGWADTERLLLEIAERA